MCPYRNRVCVTKARCWGDKVGAGAYISYRPLLTKICEYRMLQRRDNYTFLTQGPIRRVILTMAVPTIASMLVTSLYNVADTYFVGKINTQAVAAVGIVFSVMFVIQAFSFFFGNGSGNYMARELGAQRRHHAQIMASTAFVYALASGLVIMVIGLLFLEPLSVWLGSTPTILPYTKRYLGIILLGAPLMTGSLCLNNQMRFQGNASFAMWGIVSGAIINVGLNPIFIFLFDWGITGAALATVLGQLTSFLVLLYMTRYGGSMRISFRYFSFSWAYVKEILAGGTPSLSRQGLTSVASILLNVAAAQYGDAAVAAMSIANRFTMIVMASVIGLGHGFQPFCGFNYGAHLYSRVRRGFWFSVQVGTCFLLACSVLGWVFSDGIVELFRNDIEVINIGTKALRWQLVSLPAMAFFLMSNMLMQTIRKTFRANLLAASRSGLFFIPLVVILPHFLGLQGVLMSQACSDICSLLITLPLLYATFRELTQAQKSDATHRTS